MDILALLVFHRNVLYISFTKFKVKLSMVHSLSSGKGKMFLCAACHAFTLHVNAWKNLIGIVVQIQARG